MGPLAFEQAWLRRLIMTATIPQDRILDQTGARRMASAAPNLYESAICTADGAIDARLRRALEQA